MGSGPNGLAAAAIMARSGLRVAVYEAAESLGGGARSERIFDSAAVHDVCSGVHPMAAASRFFREFDLAARGVHLEYPEISYAHPLPDGRSGIAYRDLERTSVRLGRDGHAWRALMEPLVANSTDLVDLMLSDLRHVPPGARRALGGMRLLGPRALIHGTSMARRVSVAGWWRRRRLITTANGLSATGPSGARESNAATTNEGAATFREGSNNACLAAALDARNIPYTSRKLTIRGRNQRVILCRINDVPYAIAGASIRLFDGNDTARGSIDRRAARFVKQKDKLAEHLTERGFSVPRGTAFDGDEFDTALDYFDTHAGTYMSGFCLKPTNGNMGQHVHTSITSRDGFRAAFADVAGAHDRVLVQEMIPGAVYRMLSVGGTVIAVGTGVPMNVTGNGSSSIKELVEAKQRARRANPAHSRYRFELGDSELAALEANGLSPESIPASDTTVYLSETSNLHRGAEFTDFTDAIDPSHKTEVERAVASIPGLRVCGADVIIRDYAKPAEPDNHVILELNREPGLTGHHYPWSGQSRDAAGAIVNLMRTLTLADHDARK